MTLLTAYLVGAGVTAAAGIAVVDAERREHDRQDLFDFATFAVLTGMAAVWPLTCVAVAWEMWRDGREV